MQSFFQFLFRLGCANCQSGCCNRNFFPYGKSFTAIDRNALFPCQLFKFCTSDPFRQKKPAAQTFFSAKAGVIGKNGIENMISFDDAFPAGGKQFFQSAGNDELESNGALPLATRMETRLAWRPTRGSLTSRSFLVRNRTLGPLLKNNPETPPSSRDEGLRLLHGLETNLAASLQTPQEA